MRRPSPADAVRFRAGSANGKLAPVLKHNPIGPYVSHTQISIWKTCPPCPLKGVPAARGGCSTQASRDGVAKRLDDAAGPWTADQIIAAEVAAIDNAFGGGPIPQDGARGGRDLRLHVGGDVLTTQHARLLAGAAQRWLDRGGGRVWCFTRSWPSIPRSAWGPISIIASVDRPEDIKRANGLGYVVAIIVPEFPNDAHKFFIEGTDTVVHTRARPR